MGSFHQHPAMVGEFTDYDAKRTPLLGLQQLAPSDQPLMNFMALRFGAALPHDHQYVLGGRIFAGSPSSTSESEEVLRSCGRYHRTTLWFSLDSTW
ncbi:MAG: hypothetical protein H6527_01745 [Actinobacteria bacterium]|nr:hypothetical protein [Actinomycetota bacterium]